jgi:putative ABC transport system permease protein
MKYLPLVSANLWRKPMRTVLTFVSVVLGFTLVGLTFGLHASLRNMAESARADRIYTSARFSARMRLPQLEVIAGMHGVLKVAALDAVEGYYQHPGNNVAVLMPGPGIRAVFPELSLTERQWQMLAEARQGVFVSRLIAMRYGLRPGTYLPLISHGSPKADGSDVWIFDVLGVVPDISLMPVGFALGNFEYLDQARLQSDRGVVSQFWTLARDARYTDELMTQIDSTFANSSVPTKSVSERTLLAGAGGSSSDSVLAITAMSVMGVLMITFLTANAIAHSTRERTRELAVLKTLGFSNVAIVSLILAEATIPCVLGCLGGLAVAAGVAARMPAIAPQGFLLPMPQIGSSVTCVAVGFALLIPVVSAALPASRIARLDVAAVLARI